VCARLVESGRTVLVLCKRVAQVETLLTLTRERGVNTSALQDGVYDADADVLITTCQKAGVGFSHDRLDSLVLAADVEEAWIQYLGRVFRTPEVSPLVVDLLDKHSVLKKHYKTRLDVYTKAGGVVRVIKRVEDLILES
jgi:hypothetical protein